MKSILIFFSLYWSISVIAQDYKINWGKITQQEVDLKQVEYDSSASAVVLSEYGSVSAKIGDGVTLNRYTRIKILNEAGKDYADIQIPYFHYENKEWITDLKAQIINVVDGKPVIDVLDKKDFFRVKIDDKRSELRFTFPKVAVGSIIEFRYTRESKSYFTLESWEFQNEIPTLHSYFKALIGPNLVYSIMYQGPRLINQYGTKSTNIWELENLPGIKSADYCPNPFDFTEKIKFQLAKYYSNGFMNNVIKSWEDVTFELIKDSDIKLYLNKNKEAKKMLGQILDGSETEVQKIEKIYSYLTSNFDWNGSYWYYPQKKYKNLIEQKSGNSGEINLLFINLLNAAGFEAHPAMLSTKEHGFVAKDITFFSQFNNLIACTKLNGKDILLDATNPIRPYNLLDQEYLNCDVLVLKKKDPYWLKIHPHSRNQTFKMVEMKMASPGSLEYNLKVNAKGYEAENLRYDYFESEKDLSTLLSNELLSEATDFNIKSSNINNLKELNKSIRVEAEIESSTNCVVNDDYVYINPFIDAAPESNPFNDKQRHLPVDLYYPFEEVLLIQFELPEGYEILELPEEANISTEQNKCKYSFNAEKVGNKLNLRLIFKVDDPFFLAHEYPALREIFDLYLAKRQEQIVLKKTALTD